MRLQHAHRAACTFQDLDLRVLGVGTGSGTGCRCSKNQRAVDLVACGSPGPSAGPYEL